MEVTNTCASASSVGIAMPFEPPTDEQLDVLTWTSNDVTPKEEESIRKSIRLLQRLSESVQRSLNRALSQRSL